MNSLDNPISGTLQVGVLKTSAVSGGYFIPSENKQVVDDEIQLVGCQVERDTFIVSRMNTPYLVGEVGYVERSYENLYLPDRLWKVRTKSSRVYTRFLALLLSSMRYQNNISSIATGTSGSMKNISKPNFLNLKIALPSLPEQQKIAAFLTAVDGRLRALRRKRELLEAYKRGVMQRVFVDPVAAKRQNRKSNYAMPYVTLAKIAKRSTSKNSENNVHKVLTNSASDGIVNQADYFDKEIANSKNLQGYFIVKPGDFVYNPRLSNLAPVGPINRNHLDTGVMSPLYTVFRILKGHPPFYEQFFKSTAWHRHMHSVANFGARHDRMNITNENFMSMPVPNPSVDLQRHIASSLSAIDDRMTLLQRQLAGGEAFKRGLLQQMFV